jgi:hypothetical protein
MIATEMLQDACALKVSPRGRVKLKLRIKSWGADIFFDRGSFKIERRKAGMKNASARVGSL